MCSHQSWAYATLDVVSQSLENFGFDALYHSTGPPYNIQLDVQGELAAARSMVAEHTFASDIEFQEHVQQLFQKTIDAHTRYQKPACYNAVFVQPFAFDMRLSQSPDSLEEEPIVYLTRNLYTDQYRTMFPDIPLDEILGQQVSLLDGVEFTTAVSGWGDTHETRSNNRGIRFNAALRTYLYRSAMAVNVLPLADLQVTLIDGSVHTLPWIASYTAGLADVSLCAAQPEDVTAKKLSSRQRVQADPMGPDSLTAPHELVHEALHSPGRTDRTVIVPTDSTYYVSCFLQAVSGDAASGAGVSNVLVMKVASFSPPGDYLDAW